MPIAKGEPWGTNQPLPATAPVVSSDVALAELVVQWRARGEQAGPVGVLGGDLCRTLGGRGDRTRLYEASATWVACDVGTVSVDGGPEQLFVAHVVAHRTAWHGQFVAAVNAEWVGGYRLGPRSHPGDGLLDVTDGALPLRQRLLARRRARTGDHLPHPSLRHRREPDLAVELARPCPVWVDGRRIGTGRLLHFTVEPAGVLVVV
jgi:hypothetical protein